MSQFISSFNNREIAAGIWLVILVLGSTASRDIRSAMVDVLKAFFVRPILVNVLLLAGYLACIVVMLAIVGAWTAAQLKVTLLWFFTSGLVGLSSSPRLSEEPDIFPKYLRNIVSITILLEFFVNLYQMPILAELVFVPFSAILGMLIVKANAEEEYASTRKLLHGVAVIVGLFLIAYAIWNSIFNFDSIANIGTVRSFYLPIIFSAFQLPFLWLCAVYMAYERIFVRMWVVTNNETLHPYIKRSLILRFRLDIRSIGTWFKTARSQNLDTKTDVDQSIQDCLK